MSDGDSFTDAFGNEFIVWAPKWWEVWRWIWWVLWHSWHRGYKVVDLTPGAQSVSRYLRTEFSDVEALLRYSNDPDSGWSKEREREVWAKIQDGVKWPEEKG